MDYTTAKNEWELLQSLLRALKALLPEGWGDGTMDHMPGVKEARLAIERAEKLLK